MNTALKTLLASLSLALAAGATMAQPAPAAGSNTMPGIHQHQARQEHRIAQGVASGQLTRHEARRLHREQLAIRHAKRMARADGVVTPAERHHIRHLQAHASRDIHRQKHDAQTRAYVPSAFPR